MLISISIEAFFVELNVVIRETRHGNAGYYRDVAEG